MKDLLFCRDNNRQQQDCQYDSMQDQTYISVPGSPNFKVTKKFPRTQFPKYRFKNQSASVSKRSASKLRLKTARKSRLILNKSWIRDKLSNYTPFDFLPGSPLSKKSRKYPSRKYLSRIYPSRKYLTLLSLVLTGIEAFSWPVESPHNASNNLLEQFMH